jgi:spore coat polysaccharide biosynthesis protein SpsF
MSSGERSGCRPAATAIIQARMNSTRLPGKSLLDLGGKPLLHHVIDRARAIEGVTTVVLATAHGEENIPLVELARVAGIDIFIGSLDNVLERFYIASQEFPADYIIRITGDNPFTDPEYASIALSIAAESSADLCSISNLPLGTAVEIIKKQALDEAYRSASKPYHFEHVTPYIKEHDEIFRIERHEVTFPNPFPDLRLTVDTDEDYRLARLIYENLYTGEIIPLKRVISFLSEHPEMAAINSNVRQRPMTHSSQK